MYFSAMYTCRLRWYRKAFLS